MVISQKFMCHVILHQTIKLGKSVDSIDEDDGDEVNTKLIENNNNDDNKQDRVPLARAGTSCVT